MRPGTAKTGRVRGGQRGGHLPLPIRHAVAEELLRRADGWHLGHQTLGGYQTIANQAGCTYENVRSIQRQLIWLGRAPEEVST